ncbi:uncharacterized protein LOC144637304 [Oculina patagonica]
MTRRQLMMMSDTNTKNTIAAVNTTLGLKLDNLDSALNQLKSALNSTNNDLAELNSTQTKEKVIYHQTMTPSWLEAHASYINSDRLYTTEQVTFNAGSVHNAALFKVPMIPEDALQNSTLLTVKIVVSNDVDIGSNGDRDIRFGVSDGISFVGFETVDNETYTRNFAPCFGIEGTSGSRLSGRRDIKPKSSPRPSDSFYPGQFAITLKLDERWGSCYTAHDAGFVKTAEYNKRMMLSKGLTLEVYKHDKRKKAGIKFIEVTIIQDV